ncbi:conjugal transfer protein TraN [Vibrio harveyi]|uniref:conjugal transfer protein TraN n=1 Tax=Vibrio harveyi TaxID=669 RepID=UPI003BB4FF4A
MKNFLCILLMITTTVLQVNVVQAKTMMCGFDADKNSFIEQGEIASCIGSNNSVCPIGSATCNKKTDVFTHTPDVRCPSGFVLNPDSKICEKTTVTNSYLQCPDDYSLKSGKCQKLVSKDYVPTCPSGFSLQGGRCKKLLTQPVTLTCPANYALYNGKCRNVATKPVKLNCPSGFALQGNQCRKITSKDVNLSCPVGYSLYNGSCKKTLTETIKLTCPNGYSLKGGECEKTQSTSVNLVCPTGYSDNGSNCIRYGWQDPTAYACENSSATLKGKTCTISECRWGRNGKLIEFSGATEGWWDGRKVFRINRYSERIPLPWVKGEHSPASNHGQNLYREFYLCKNDVTPAKAMCPSGYSDVDGRCRKTLIVPKTAQCPSGYTKSGNRCYKTIKINPQQSCRDGYTNNGTVCTKTEYRNPNKSCDSGYALSGNQCTKTEYQNPSKYCDSGFSLSGNSCKKTSYLNATKVCSDGFTLKTNQCEKAVYQEIVKTCESGFNLSGNKCNKWFFTVPDELCPAGFSKDSSVTGVVNKCTKTNTDQPDYLCPTGYTYNSREGVCKKEVERSVCPSDESIPCQDNGFGQMVCSPNKCMDIDDPANADIIDVDGKMLVDDGARAADGTCMDSVYIYNGRSMYCKKKGVQSAWQDCCKNKGKVMQDGAGGFNTISYAYQGITKIYEAAEAAYTAYAAATAAGESAAVASSAASSAATNSLMIGVDPASIAIAVAIYLVMEWVANACKKEELETAMAVGSGYCHFVGDYCKKKVKFIGCIQKAKSYCCFNSKLARIIHEQGRPQLKSFDGWGKAGQPNCRGFSPDEFQSIDFSQIDLEEYVNELKKNAQDEVSQDITEITTDFFDKVK